MDDKQLMAQIAAGDQAALQTLLRRHGPLLQYILKPILTDPREREECLADISLRLWQRAGDYAPERGAFVPWLTVLARNMALNRARRLRREEPLDEAMPHGDGSAEEALLQKDRREQLQTAIRSLGREEQQLFFRKYYYCQSTAQIAAELGISSRTVKRFVSSLLEKTGYSNRTRLAIAVTKKNFILPHLEEE